jgi:hypothetical protein
MANIKNSTYNTKNSRFTKGGITEVSKFALEWWDKNPMPKDASDIVYIMEEKYENRPDLLGYLFYGDPLLWWVIGVYNGITDPLNELALGKVLYIPLKERLENELFSKVLRVGGVSSTRGV